MTPPRLSELTGEQHKAFSMDGRVELLDGYVDNSLKPAPCWFAQEWAVAVARVRNGWTGHYRGIDTWLYEALRRYPLPKNGRVAIMGSADQGFGPWYEAVAWYYGGRPTTVDYNPVFFGEGVPCHWMQAPLQPGAFEPFDAALAISTFEHSGLGRYGDPLDPDGDLKAMWTMRHVLKRDGLLFLSVPIGRDKVVFNCHRIYGRLRLPLLLDGWIVTHPFGYGYEESQTLLDRETYGGWEPRGPDGKLLHPDYPEYGPVFVLRNP
jgi:hypothetical protein